MPNLYTAISDLNKFCNTPDAGSGHMVGGMRLDCLLMRVNEYTFLMLIWDGFVLMMLEIFKSGYHSILSTGIS